MAGRLEMRQTGRRTATCLQPLIDGAGGVAGRRQMVGEVFGLALDKIRELMLQHRRDAGVQLLASGAQQGAVGGVLHQRVLEQLGGIRCHAAAEQQTRLG